MLKANHIISKLYYNTFGRFIICVKLYCNDLHEFNSNEKLEQYENFQFIIPTEKELFLLEKIYESNSIKLKIINDRIKRGNYICFAYQDKNNGNIAYTRWLCMNTFYSDTLRKQFSFSANEALTLDSYTHPDYRYRGLHKNMNILMLKWIKENTEIQHVYMVIKCFIPHLTKIPKELGYKPIEKTTYYKKGSISLIIKKVLEKIIPLC